MSAKSLHKNICVKENPSIKYIDIPFKFSDLWKSMITAQTQVEKEKLKDIETDEKYSSIEKEFTSLFMSQLSNCLEITRYPFEDGILEDLGKIGREERYSYTGETLSKKANLIKNLQLCNFLKKTKDQIQTDLNKMLGYYAKDHYQILTKQTKDLFAQIEKLEKKLTN